MKILLKILGVIVALIVLLLIVALFVSKDYSVEQEIVINKPKQQVYDYVKLMRNQEHYNVWTMADPNAKKEYRGTDGTVGFVYYWNGNDEVGEGELEIKQLVEGEKVNMELRFKRPMEGVGKTYIHTASATPEQTKVIWGMTGSTPYPFNLMTLLMKGRLEKDLQKSLVNMKNNIEQ